MKYKLQIPFKNREDLLREAVESTRAIGNAHIWADGVPSPDIAGVTHHQLPPMSSTAVYNMFIQNSWDDDVMFHQHTDARALDGVAERFKAFIEKKFAEDSKWGVVFTNYDTLCAFNMKAVRDVGYWDPMFFQYVADDDYYHRMGLAGWEVSYFADHSREVFQPPRVIAGVFHHESSTFKSDPLYNYVNNWRNKEQVDRKYYILKWGSVNGRYGHNTTDFIKPFENFVDPDGYRARKIKRDGHASLSPTYHMQRHGRKA